MTEDEIARLYFWKGWIYSACWNTLIVVLIGLLVQKCNLAP